MTIKEEVIKVKDADDVTFKVRLTRHGPIIDEINHYKEPKNTALRCGILSILRIGITRGG